MEKQISKYTENEKETIKKIEDFQSDLMDNLNNWDEIFKVEYYSKLRFFRTIEVNGDFYIATITTADEKTKTAIYAGDSRNLLGYVDEQGNIEFVDELLKNLDISLTIKDLENMNLENLRGKSEEAKSKELEKYLQEEDNKKKEKNENKYDEENDGEENDGEENDGEGKTEQEQVDQELSEENGEDLEISYYREIKDDQMQKEFPDKFSGAESIGLAYSKAMNRFIMAMKTNGRFKKVDGFKPAKPTLRTVISMNEDGSKIERKSPHALMQTDDDRKEVSVTIGQYGYTETGIVDRLPCNERIEHQVREDGQTEAGKTNKDMRYTINNEGKEEIHEWVHEFSKNEEIGLKTQNLEAIDGSRQIKLKNGTITTLQQEADKDKVSLKEFVRTFIEAEGNTIDEKLENTHDEFERQVGVAGHRRDEIK